VGAPWLSTRCMPSSRRPRDPSTEATGQCIAAAPVAELEAAGCPSVGVPCEENVAAAGGTLPRYDERGLLTSRAGLNAGAGRQETRTAAERAIP
jgi:hypothetical protein